MSPLADRIEAKTAQTLSTIVYAMAMGLVMLSGVVGLMHVQSKRSPTPPELAAVNTMTMIAMGVAAALIVASELVWKALLRKADEANVNQAVTTAFIVRSALREGAGLLGAVVALIAAMNGAMRVYPAYWADLAPAALFLVYAFTHAPTLPRLRAEVAEVLGA